jgi:hypothetical protein
MRLGECRERGTRRPGIEQVKGVLAAYLLTLVILLAHIGVVFDEKSSTVERFADV